MSDAAFQTKPYIVSCGIDCKTCEGETHRYFERYVGNYPDLLTGMTGYADQLLSLEEVDNALAEIGSRFVHLRRQHHDGERVDEFIMHAGSRVVLCAIARGFIDYRFEEYVVRRYPSLFERCTYRTPALLKTAILHSVFRMGKELLISHPNLVAGMDEKELLEIIKSRPSLIAHIDMKYYTYPMLETAVKAKASNYKYYQAWHRMLELKMAEIVLKANGFE